jgi:hypothetical protein
VSGGDHRAIGGRIGHGALTVTVAELNPLSPDRPPSPQLPHSHMALGGAVGMGAWPGAVGGASPLGRLGWVGTTALSTSAPTLPPGLPRFEAAHVAHPFPARSPIDSPS